MNARLALLALVFCLVHAGTMAQTTDSQLPRAITLREAVDLALQHNHVVRLASLKVDRNSWPLPVGASMSTLQTTEFFMNNAAKKIAEELAAKKKN